jgi:hypothetical protein
MARFQRTDIELLFPDGQAATRAQLEHDPRWLEVHAGQRPLCRCTPAGVEMLVRHRQGRHFLANLPGRSHHHSLGCPSYAPDPLIDPRRHYSAAALARSGEICHVVVAADPLGSPPFAHFTPQAALELLWDSANLTLWSPRMRGRRSYTAVRAALLGAACLVLVLAGTRLRWNAPLLVGAVVGGLLVLRELAPYAAATPQWVLIGLAGTVLTVVGVTWERRVRDLHQATAYLGRLR